MGRVGVRISFDLDVLNISMCSFSELGLNSPDWIPNTSISNRFATGRSAAVFYKISRFSSFEFSEFALSITCMSYSLDTRDDC